MDELGSYPRIRFGDHNQFTHDAYADQNGSWLGLAISGLKFLMTPTPPNTQTSATPSHQKPHILGPSSYRNQLYDIEEEAVEGHAPLPNPLPSLTHKTLQQFNGHFSHYWNQRSSLHSEHTLSDGGGSSSTQREQRCTDLDASARPSMTSSQIIHPTQSQKRSKAKTLQRSASFPLLHSAEYRSLELFALSNPSRESNGDMEGSTTSIPSPPTISSTPELGMGMSLSALKSVQPIKSWGSVQSVRSVRSVDRGDCDSVRSNQSNRSDIVYVKRGSQGASSRSTLVHIHSGSKEASEVGWEESVSAIRRRAQAAEDENVCFSDWSNVSSVVERDAKSAK